MLHQSGGQLISKTSCSLGCMISVITLVYIYKTLKNKHFDHCEFLRNAYGK